MSTRLTSIIALTFAVAVAAGCLAPTAATPPAVTTSPTPAPTVATPAPTPSPSPTSSAEPPSPAPVPTPTAEPSPTPSSGETFGRGTVLEVIVDGLRIRSAPRVAVDSDKLTPLLSARELVYVADGPVRASGYDWYLVLPFRDRFPWGWIAAASREGEQWVRPTDRGCDSTRLNAGSVGRLTAGEALGCYGGEPHTFEARIVRCLFDVDGPPVKPAWFGFQLIESGGKTIAPCLVAPDQREADPDSWVWAHFDPDGRYPDQLPIDRPVLVTGRYDHPAARRCRGEDLLPDPVLICRTTFVITRVQRAD